MSKDDCIMIFNSMIEGKTISWDKFILPLISDYLTEINCEKSTELISLIVANPNLAKVTFGKIIPYYIRKYGILSILFNNKTILYYE